MTGEFFTITVLTFVILILKTEILGPPKVKTTRKKGISDENSNEKDSDDIPILCSFLVFGS